MIEATFTVSASDFNDEIIEKIKSYLKGQHAVVTISIQTEPVAAPQKETREAYFAKLDKSIAALEDKENLVTFAMEEFKAFAKK